MIIDNRDRQGALVTTWSMSYGIFAVLDENGARPFKPETGISPVSANGWRKKSI